MHNYAFTTITPRRIFLKSRTIPIPCDTAFSIASNFSLCAVLLPIKCPTRPTSKSKPILSFSIILDLKAISLNVQCRRSKYLKTFTSLGAYGTSVITTVTVQNTRSVSGLLGISPVIVSQQLEAVLCNVPVHAMKIGLLHLELVVIEVVADSLSRIFPVGTTQPPLVVDPVMVSTSGHSRVAWTCCGNCSQLLPRATLLIPNLPKALMLSGRQEHHLTIESLRDIHITGDREAKILQHGSHAEDLCGKSREREPQDNTTTGKRPNRLPGTSLTPKERDFSPSNRLRSTWTTMSFSSIIHPLKPKSLSTFAITERTYPMNNYQKKGRPQLHPISVIESVSAAQIQSKTSQPGK
ncbi:hypothetical protein VP01_225g4 [Puccinia sorghi]|uniref:Pyridoxamine kinase/Phosphomethylpyrimidine kinase domain-containing protein n=1 Tax=Puccinia sorghi TaxID=27349 RepID=A0A0L6V892_9BASI|nr:hypothetical protein VP01_225g4 [Puccinia sorghi]